MDQQRTRRIVRVVAIIMVIGLVGVLPVALGVILFGGNDAQSATEQIIKDAETKVASDPSVINLVALAAQYQSNGRAKDAADTLQKAVTTGPKNVDELRTLVGAFGNESSKQISLLRDYTKKFPKDGDGWFTYGSTAAGIGETQTARLAYQRAIDLAKPGSELETNAKTALDNLANIETNEIVPTTPATP